MQKLLIHFILGMTLTLQGACTVHKAEIQQGNVVTPDALTQIKTGMSKKQVTFLLGTPLIIDPFHPDRWDYVYALKGETRQQRISLWFENDVLSRIEGQRAPEGMPH